MDRLHREWVNFRRVYPPAALAMQMAELPNWNRDEERRIAAENKLIDSRNKRADRDGDESKHEARLVFTPATHLPLKNILVWALKNATLNLASMPSVEFLVTTWLVTIDSQAPVEAAFSKLKKIVTHFRKKLSQPHIDMMMAIVMNSPESPAGSAAGFTKEEFLKLAFRIWCTLETRKVAVAKYQAAVDVSDTFGDRYDTTTDGKKVIEDAMREVSANKAKVMLHQGKQDGDGAVSDYVIGSGATIETELVFVECTSEFGSHTYKRACFAERGDRTPQINDEIAITGFGGTVWWPGRIYALKKSTRKSKFPTFMVDVIHAGDSPTRTMDMKLSDATYGPAQCKVGSVRYQSENIADSYTLGWVFLVPEVPAAAAAAAAAAPGDVPE